MLRSMANNKSKMLITVRIIGRKNETPGSNKWFFVNSVNPVSVDYLAGVAANEKLHRRRAKQLRTIGAVVLALGIVAAGLVYWIGTRNAAPDDISMLGFNRAEQRQMGLLYGKSGQMMDDWVDDLKQPGTQAILILIFSAVVFAGCRYFAKLVEIDDEPADDLKN